MSRSQDLKDWYLSRRAEIGMDVFSYVFAGLVGIGISYPFLPSGALVGAVVSPRRRRAQASISTFAGSMCTATSRLHHGPNPRLTGAPVARR